MFHNCYLFEYMINYSECLNIRFNIIFLNTKNNNILDKAMNMQ